MLTTLRTLIPLFFAEGLLLGGGGLIATVLSISGKRAGFDPTMIGLIGTGYFAGYLIGCFVNPRLVKTVGHIRVFAAYSAIAGASTLLFALFVEPWVWIAVRALAGFCFSGLFMVMEGWINGASTNQNARAGVFCVSHGGHGLCGGRAVSDAGCWSGGFRDLCAHQHADLHIGRTCCARRPV